MDGKRRGPAGEEVSPALASTSLDAKPKERACQFC